MYDHSKKAGSIYDTFKHACLINITEKFTPKTYFESHCGYPYYYRPERWDSSWLKIHRKTKCQLILCDINPEVIKTIQASGVFIAPSQVIRGDGFTEVYNQTFAINPPDLVFIDPPYKDDTDWTNVIKSISDLDQAKIKWIVWYPIFRDHSHLIFDKYKRIEMKWSTDKYMFGCGMIFGGFKKKHLKPVYNSLHFLEWCLTGRYSIKEI